MRAVRNPPTNDEVVGAQALHFEPIVSERARIFRQPAFGDHALETGLFDQLEEFPAVSDHVPCFSPAREAPPPSDRAATGAAACADQKGHRTYKPVHPEKTSTVDLFEGCDRFLIGDSDQSQTCGNGHELPQGLTSLNAKNDLGV